MTRIGIYSGTFDPVHSGHIAFALQSQAAGNLDSVYFLPERRPRAKTQVEHYAHRVAMLKRALRPHPQFEVMEMVDAKFSVGKTLPALAKLFPSSQLVFLFGSDVIEGLASWPHADQLLKEGELIIGLRNQDKRDAIKKVISGWKTKSPAITIFNSYAPHVSSGKIRSAIRKRKPTSGLLASVERYSDNHWLYISLGGVDTA